MIDLHLISWNRPEMTELVIKTIHRNTKRDNFRLVVLDNGSSGETPDRLGELYDVGLIDEYFPLKTNIGLESARNFLFEQSTISDLFVDMDNDCLPPPPMMGWDWVERLVELMQRYEDYAAISARTQVMIGTGNIFEQADKDGADLVEFPHPGGSLRIMDSKAVHRVGGWKGNTPGRGAEERYIGGKLHEAGYKTGFAVHVKTLHLFGPTTTDSWGYPKDWKPQDTGLSPDVWHPVFATGDDPAEMERYCGRELLNDYMHSQKVG